jgi:hypothetical protein
MILESIVEVNFYAIKLRSCGRSNTANAAQALRLARQNAL